MVNFGLSSAMRVTTDPELPQNVQSILERCFVKHERAIAGTFEFAILGLDDSDGKSFVAFPGSLDDEPSVRLVLSWDENGWCARFGAPTGDEAFIDHRFTDLDKWDDRFGCNFPGCMIRTSLYRAIARANDPREHIRPRYLAEAVETAVAHIWPLNEVHPKRCVTARTSGHILNVVEREGKIAEITLWSPAFCESLVYCNFVGYLRVRFLDISGRSKKLLSDHLKQCKSHMFGTKLVYDAVHDFFSAEGTRYPDTFEQDYKPPLRRFLSKLTAPREMGLVPDFNESWEHWEDPREVAPGYWMPQRYRKFGPVESRLISASLKVAPGP
jgi:hypothetical protein